MKYYTKYLCFNIIDLPEKKPIITGLRRRYHVGDLVRVNCTSAKSKPAAALSWYINGEKVSNILLVDFYILLTNLHN